MPDLVPIPPAIYEFVYKLGMEGKTWAFGEFADGTFKHFDDLNVSDCEQLVAAYVDRARRAVRRYLKRPTRKAAKRAAEFIDRARMYRDLYRQMLHLPVDERDMPFPVMTQEQFDQWQAEEAGE